MKKLIKRASILFTALLTLSVGTSYTVKEVKAADENYKLVTDVNDLSIGDNIIIVKSDATYALSTTRNSNNIKAIGITPNSDGTIKLKDSIETIELVAGATTGFGFRVSDGYLYAASTSSNHLKVKSTLDNKGSFNISIDSSGVATVKADQSARNWLRFNPNNGSPIFSCYTSGQNDISIYEKVVDPSKQVFTSTATVGYDATTQKVSWSKVEGAAYYDLSIMDENGELVVKTYKEIDTLSFKVPYADLKNNTNYKASVVVYPEDTNNYTESEPTMSEVFNFVYSSNQVLSTKNTTASLSFDYSLTYGEIAVTGGKYSLVTDASTLKVDDKVIIVANGYDYAISTTQNGNNRAQTAVEKTDSGSTIKSVSSDVEVFTLKQGNVNGTFAFYDETEDVGYLYAASSEKNYLRTETNLSNNSSFKITISDNIATIVAQGSYNRNTLQYNQSSSIFSCYGSASQQAISIYKYESVGSGSTTIGLTNQNYDNVKIKFGVELNAELFASAPTAAGVFVTKGEEMITGATGVNLDTYLENTTYKQLPLSSAPTLNNDNVYSVAGAIQVYADGEFASATDERLTTLLTAAVYFVVDGEVVILNSKTYSVETMIDEYLKDTTEFDENTILALEAFQKFIG